jgi:hypothetical protein
VGLLLKRINASIELMQATEMTTINNFVLTYVPDQGIVEATFNGTSLYQLLNLPEMQIVKFDPINSRFIYSPSVIDLADSVFTAINDLNVMGHLCLAAMLASFYNSSGSLADEFMDSGRHILTISLWISVLELVRNWEEKHPKSLLHIGTPLYFLAQGYLLTQNNDPAFIYLIKSIEDDIELSKHCPNFNYPESEPAYLTTCLVENDNNYNV